MDKEIEETEIENNITKNPELPEIECENMEVDRQGKQRTIQTLLTKKKQIDIRDAMKAQETAKRYSNRQRIEPTITRPIYRTRNEISGISKTNQLNILQSNQQKKKNSKTQLNLTI